jgi:hypothetical protein
MRQVVAVFVVTRLALLVTVLAALSFLTPASCSVCREASSVPLLSGLANWDGAAYLDIARLGYQSLDPSYAAYFPLYPLLMRLGGLAGGGSADAFIAAGLVLSNAACLAAAIVLARLAPDEARGKKAAGYLLMFPTTIFLSALYADSLFIALAAASALAAQRNRWWSSGALAGAAALTRPFGILSLIPLCVALWRERATAPRVSILAILVPPAALALWEAYLYALTGDPLAVVHGYTSGFTPRQPLQAFTDLLDPSVYGFPYLVAGAFALFIALTVIAWRVTDRGLAAYATVMMLVIGGAGSLTSSMRYELSVYPAFIALADAARSRALNAAWLVLSALLALFFAAMFALDYWAG